MDRTVLLAQKALRTALKIRRSRWIVVAEFFADFQPKYNSAAFLSGSFPRSSVWTSISSGFCRCWSKLQLAQQGFVGIIGLGRLPALPAHRIRHLKNM